MAYTDIHKNDYDGAFPVGEYWLSICHHGGGLWIENKEHEGGQFDEHALSEVIGKFFWENF